MRLRARTNSVRQTSVAKRLNPVTLLPEVPGQIWRSTMLIAVFKRARIFECLFAMVLTGTIAGCGGYGGGSGGGGTGSAPAVVAGLTATPGSAQVSLTWNASSGATGYYIKRSTTSGAETQIAAQAATTYTDSAVTSGTKYFYTVAAYNSYGVSTDSTEVSATPQAPVTPPAVPIGLIATPGDTTVS